MRGLRGAICVMILASACSPRAGRTPVGPTFTDGTWLFLPTLEWNRGGDVQFPRDTIPAASYVPIAAGRVDTVFVSGNGRLISIGAHGHEGQRADSAGSRLWFEMPWGRFLVWSAGTGLQAELTVYGSGRPIVSSLRGPLVPGP